MARTSLMRYEITGPDGKAVAYAAGLDATAKLDALRRLAAFDWDGPPRGNYRTAGDAVLGRYRVRNGQDAAGTVWHPVITFDDLDWYDAQVLHAHFYLHGYTGTADAEFVRNSAQLDDWLAAYERDDPARPAELVLECGDIAADFVDAHYGLPGWLRDLLDDEGSDPLRGRDFSIP